MEGHIRKLEELYSAELVQVVRWCLQLDPLQRPQSVFSLQKVLMTQVPEKKELSLGSRIKLKLERLQDVFNRAKQPEGGTIQDDSI